MVFKIPTIFIQPTFEHQKCKRVCYSDFHYFSLKTLKKTCFNLFFSYKYVSMIFLLLIGLLLQTKGYYIALAYLSAALAFFLLRTLKLRIEPEVNMSPVNSKHVVCTWWCFEFSTYMLIDQENVLTFWKMLLIFTISLSHKFCQLITQGQINVKSNLFYKA